MIWLLDFDGVIVDSRDECALATWNAGASVDFRTLTSLPKGWLEWFRGVRRFVRPAGEYGVLYDAWTSGDRILDEVGFHSRCNPEAVKQFAEKFHAARRRHQEDDPAGWLALHRLFDEASVLTRPTSQSAFLVTNKDGDSVRRLLKALLPQWTPRDIYAREQGLDKADLVKQLCAAQGWELQHPDLLFVDDHPDHCRDVAQTGVQVRLAGWGYWRGIQLADSTLSVMTDLCEMDS